MNRRILIRASCIAIVTLIVMAFAFATERVSTQRQDFIDYALQFRGTEYVYGGRTPEEGFDCSGYVSYVANHGANILLPRTAQAIYQRVTPVTVKEREPGDLVFFKNDMSSERITHVGIYLGNNQMIHCGDPIKITNISTNYWTTHFYTYGRIKSEYR